MIAQVVFDLPLEGPFDYAIPADAEKQVVTGCSVGVQFGPKKRIGIVIGLLPQSDFKNLKSIKAVLKKPILDNYQIQLGHQLSRYYGCSLGDALFTILRGCEGQQLADPLIRDNPSKPVLSVCADGNNEAALLHFIQPLASKNQRVLVLVPDQSMVSAVEGMLKKIPKDRYVIGTRSAVFRSLVDISLVIMVDEDSSSFKQEQSPMYEAREILLMRAKIEKIRAAFVSTAPSVELMHLVEQGEIKLEPPVNAQKVLQKPQVIDLNNYKIITKGVLSPALLSTLEQNVPKKLKSILVFNHRGSYSMTRCTDCGFVLKCTRCASPMIFSRSKKQYLCRYCTSHLPGDTVCPVCKKPSWKSFGMGIEQMQKALQEKFPSARIQTFERESQGVLKEFDILIGTWALLRFKNVFKVDLVAFLDIDSELNRLDMRSCFKAWSMVQHLRTMATGQVLIQSRQADHYCLRSLAEDKRELFYQEDMNIRRELGFSPFSHQVFVQIRAPRQDQSEKAAQEFYKALVQMTHEGMQIHAPMPETVAHKRGQYRLNILLQGQDVIGMIVLIKQCFSSLKRNSKVIVTINVDP